LTWASFTFSSRGAVLLPLDNMAERPTASIIPDPSFCSSEPRMPIVEAGLVATSILTVGLSAILSKGNKTAPLDEKVKLAQVKEYLQELTADMEVLAKQDRDAKYNYDLSVSGLGFKTPGEAMKDMKVLRQRWLVYTAELKKRDKSKPPGGLASFFMKRSEETRRFMKNVDDLLEDTDQLQRDVQESTQTLLRRIEQLKAVESPLLLDPCGPEDLTTPTAASFSSDIQNPGNVVHA